MFFTRVERMWDRMWGRLDRFLHVYGQVKKWLILELHEIIKRSHIFACLIVSILLRDLV